MTHHAPIETCHFWLQLPNFNSLSGISFCAAVMSLGYSTIATGLTIHNGKQPGVVYNVNEFSTGDAVLSGFNSLGIIAFAYGGHNVILEIQATLPSPPPTLKPYMRGKLLGPHAAHAELGFWAGAMNLL